MFNLYITFHSYIIRPQVCFELLDWAKKHNLNYEIISYSDAWYRTFKNLDDVKKVSREEMVKAGNEDASNWQFNAPNGMYVPSDNIYFSDHKCFS